MVQSVDQTPARFITFIFLLIDVAGQRRPLSLTFYTRYNVDMAMFIVL